MTLQRHFKVAVIGCLVALTTACAPGFETTQSSVVGNGSLGGGVTNPGGGSGGTTIDPVAMDGAISGGRFDQTKVVEIDPTSKMLVMRLPFIAGFTIGAEIPLPINGVEGATIGVEMNADGSSSLVLRLPLAKLLRGVDTLPSSRLPNGDALPAIPEGELPSVGLSFKNSNLKGALYLSPTVVGLFVNTKFDPYIKLTLPIRDEARTRTYGYFTSIPAKGTYDGGFFLSIALPDDLARAIDDWL